MHTDKIINPMEVIVNHVEALIYVIDLKTYEIIYANNRCKEEFGDVLGKICYNVLQGNGESSSNELGTTFEWENKNAINSRTYFFNDKIVEWHDKRKVKIQIGIDITLQKELEKKISKLAYFDTLTSLPNRESMKTHIQNAINQCYQTKEYYSVLFIDLDNFKLVNDIKGHDTGDKVILETTSRIQKCIQEYDTLGRLGGDEFVLMLKTAFTKQETAVQATTYIAKKILKKLKTPYIIDDYTFFISASIGVALFNNDAASPAELMKFADSALNISKSNGKNRFSYFNPKLQKEIIEKEKLTDEIRTAIQKKEFCLYYQPQIAFDKIQKIVAVEALIRWNHPIKGLVLPGKFIPLAEERGLIIELGKWILEEAVKQLKKWESDTTKNAWHLSVNVSIQQFESDDFVESLQTILDVYRIKTNLLRLELTENLLINNIDKALDKLSQIKKMGMSISIDDFGTGYSSLAYLKALPIDELKIDQSFIKDIVKDTNDEIITQTIISIGKKFGLDVIAEGVETQEQFDKLVTLGCTLFQGYFFQRPTQAELY